MVIDPEFRSVPEWFQRAISEQPPAEFVLVDGAHIEWFAYGDVGKPGLLLLPGNSAHAGWWRFLAPFFANEFRVATLSWSGMGGSDWRGDYSVSQFAAEAMCVAEAAGLTKSEVPPIWAGHSFGGSPAALAATSQRLRAAIFIDARLRHSKEKWGPGSAPERAHRHYPSLETALSHFRLAPPQAARNEFIIDWLAKDAIRFDPDGEGWTWRFDPNLQLKTDLGQFEGLLQQALCPLFFIRGALSSVVTGEVWSGFKKEVPWPAAFVEIPEADHHVMIDQPLALVAALRALIASLT